MNARTITTIIFALILVAAGAVFYFTKPASQPAGININQSKNMKITSSAFKNNTNIPSKYTCDGENINPPLEISSVPTGTKSLALILHDPDAPVVGGFTHWVVFNIDPGTSEIPENSAPPDAVQGQNGAGQPKYTGPCPPTGTHHYEFRLYALDEKLSLDSSAKKADVEKAIEGHILDQIILVGLYQRQ